MLWFIRLVLVMVFYFIVAQLELGLTPFSVSLVKWLTLANEKKTTVSQDWRHKKEKSSDGKLSEDVSLE